MPSNLVLNADQNIRPALGTWIDNNTDLLLGFSLQIPENVLAGPDLQGKVPSLNINPTLAFQKVGDIASEAQILDGENSGFFHFSLCQHRRILIRADKSSCTCCVTERTSPVAERRNVSFLLRARTLITSIANVYHSQ